MKRLILAALLALMVLLVDALTAFIIILIICAGMGVLVVSHEVSKLWRVSE